MEEKIGKIRDRNETRDSRATEPKKKGSKNKTISSIENVNTRILVDGPPPERR